MLEPVPVKNGVVDTVEAEYRDTFTFLGLHGEDFSGVVKELILGEDLSAPVRTGDVLGYLVYKLDGEELGRATIIAAGDVEVAGFSDYWKRVWSLVTL